MILSEPDDTHMTVFNADEKLLELIRVIASGEGLFVWSPPTIGDVERKTEIKILVLKSRGNKNGSVVFLMGEFRIVTQ